MSAFSSTAFSTAAFSESAFDFGTQAVVDTQRGDWQVFYQDGKGRAKRWKKELLDREELRRIIRRAVLREVPAAEKYVERPQPPANTGGVLSALSPKKQSATPYIDYEAVMEDMVALQNILSWHYQRRVDIARMDEDDDDAILLMM